MTPRPSINLYSRLMKNTYLGTLALSLCLGIGACRTTVKEQPILKESDFEAAPVAMMKPDTFVEFGHQRIDPYFWMKDKKNPKVLDYIKAENAYTDKVMASTKNLQEKLYQEMIGRIKEDDESYPALDNGYYYYSRTEKGKQYATLCRKKESMQGSEEVVFDLNQMAQGKAAFIFAGYDISPDNRLAAYLDNETGSYAEFTLHIRDLSSGKDIAWHVDGASSMAWANDSKTLFYSQIDPQTLRSYRIYRRSIDEDKPTLIYEEKDTKFSTSVHSDISRQYIMINTGSSTTSEIRWISANRPTEPFGVFLPRTTGVEYDVMAHQDCFYIYYKDRTHLNGMVYQVAKADYKNKSAWKLFKDHQEDVRIDDVSVLRDYVIMDLRRNGLNEIRIYDLEGKELRNITFPEPVYSVLSDTGMEFDAQTIRYSYTSFNRPGTLYEYDIPTGKTTKLREREIPSGFNPDDYMVERLWADAADGTKIPMAVVYKKGLKRDGTAPALIYSYGSYGATSDVYFSGSIYSLVDRGFVYAIAQIRGGSDMGEQWYEDGKLLNKKNTFTDFIACSEKLIADHYTSAKKLAAMGGSAGGLLMGAVANMRPDLYQSIVAQVPFVDVISTMLDETLPLTTGEYEEWGNPNEEAYYRYMLSYSPYDNIEAKEYPNMLVTGGWNDSQVLYHEPTKYVAKLRTMKKGDNLVLLHMNMESGHGGATGRYDGLRDTAFEYAFVLNRVGINQ